MSVDIEKWGTLAVFGRPGNALAGYMEVFVSREVAGTSLGRPPDYDDSHVVSWGWVTTEQATRLVSLQPDPEFHAEKKPGASTPAASTICNRNLREICLMLLQQRLLQLGERVRIAEDFVF